MSNKHKWWWEINRERATIEYEDDEGDPVVITPVFSAGTEEIPEDDTFSITVDAGALINRAGATLTNQANATVTIEARTLNSQGGTLDNYGNFRSAGMLTNDNFLTNSGLLTNQAGGLLTNNRIIVNESVGTLTNLLGGTLINNDLL